MFLKQTFLFIISFLISSSNYSPNGLILLVTCPTVASRQIWLLKTNWLQVAESPALKA